MVSSLFLLSGIVTTLITVIIVYGFFKNYRHHNVSFPIRWFSGIIFTYMVLTILYFYWYSGNSQSNLFDFHIIYSLAVFTQTVFLYKSFSFFIHKNNLIYWLFFFLIPFFFAVSSPSIMPLVLIVVALLLQSLLFFFLLSSSPSFHKLGYVGMAYSLISLLFELLTILSFGNYKFYYFISHFIFLIFCLLFFREVVRYPVDKLLFSLGKHESHLSLFVKYFVYIVVITNLVLVTTVGVHELSHVVAARMYGCEARSIVYESGVYPYSEILCSDLSTKVPIALAGPLVPIAISIALFFVGGKFIKPISFMIFGFNLLASYKDLAEAGFSQTISFSASVIGLITVLIGIGLLAKDRVFLNAPIDQLEHKI